MISTIFVTVFVMSILGIVVAAILDSAGEEEMAAGLGGYSAVTAVISVLILAGAFFSSFG